MAAELRLTPKPSASELVALLDGIATSVVWVDADGAVVHLIDPAEDLFAMLLTQAPNQRIFFRNLFRHLVYAAVD